MTRPWLCLAARCLVLALAPGLAAVAAPTSCPENFAGGQAPDLLNPKLAVEATDLCYSAFAVEHSGATRTPLWSAEHLTADRIHSARQLPRQGSFHRETALPPKQSAELGDYACSGYDRGHMAPNGDMPTAAAQEESFSLANMIPQAPRLNRMLWEGIESAMRDLAVEDGDVFVVTGPIFKGDQLQALRGRVLVPTFVFKAVYDPRRRLATAYLTQNTDDTSYEVISIAQLTRMTGIDVFPAVPAFLKEEQPSLPAPTPHYGGRQRPLPLPQLSALQAIVDALFGETRR